MLSDDYRARAKAAGIKAGYVDRAKATVAISPLSRSRAGMDAASREFEPAIKQTPVAEVKPIVAQAAKFAREVEAWYLAGVLQYHEEVLAQTKGSLPDEGAPIDFGAYRLCRRTALLLDKALPWGYAFEDYFTADQGEKHGEGQNPGEAIAACDGSAPPQPV